MPGGDVPARFYRNGVGRDPGNDLQLHHEVRYRHTQGLICKLRYFFSLYLLKFIYFQN